MNAEPAPAVVDAARRGSTVAFGKIVEAHQQTVRGFVRRLGASPADADDLAQDTFVTAWSTLHRWRPDRALRAWLCGIAYNKWQTHLRGAARRRAREQADADDRVAAPFDAQALDAVRVLAALPDEQRAAVALCLGAEFSHGEAAIALGLPLGTVKSHVHRGREKLVALLGASRERH